jgi:hypothetical protein
LRRSRKLRSRNAGGSNKAQGEASVVCERNPGATRRESQAHEVGARGRRKLVGSLTLRSNGRTSITRFTGSVFITPIPRVPLRASPAMRDSALRFTLGCIRVARIRGLSASCQRTLQPKANFDGLIDSVERLLIDCTQSFDQTGAVNRADLVEQGNRRNYQPCLFSR